MVPLKNDGKPHRIALLGIYLADIKNTANHLSRVFSETISCDVEQYWAHLGDGVPKGWVSQFVKIAYSSPVPRMIVLNSLLKMVNLDKVDFLIVTDDDIVINRNFIDSFIGLQIQMDLALAQPARTFNSWIDHEITRRVNNVQGRLTRFVEIGPLFSIHKRLFDFVLPFETLSPMGWGLDYVWPVIVEKAGLRMGIIDAIAVDHSLRKPRSGYVQTEAYASMMALFAHRSHLKPEEAEVIIQTL